MPITLQTLKELLTAPHEVLPKKAKMKDRNEAIVILVMNWILVVAGIALISNNYSLIPAILVLGILGTLIVAFFVYLALTLAGGKGDYTSVLVSVTYPFFGISFSTLIISLIHLWSKSASIAAGVILFPLYYVVGLIGMFRVLKENFRVDLVTIWVIISLLALAILLAIYEVAILYAFASNFSTELIRSITQSL